MTTSLVAELVWIKTAEIQVFPQQIFSSETSDTLYFKFANFGKHPVMYDTFFQEVDWIQ